MNPQSGQGSPKEMYVNHSVGGSDSDGSSVALEINHHGSWKTNGKSEPVQRSLLHPLMLHGLSWHRGILRCHKAKFYADGTVEKKTRSALEPRKPPSKMREGNHEI